MKSDYEMKCTCKLRSVQDSEERIKNYQLSEISPALSEILVDGKYHYPSKVSQETAVVLYRYPLKTDELDRVGGYVLNCEILREVERDTHLNSGSLSNCFRSLRVFFY